VFACALVYHREVRFYLICYGGSVKFFLSTIAILFCSVFSLVGLRADVLIVPPEIKTTNVPMIDRAVGERLSGYLNVRSATAVGWQDNRMLVVTRFGETSQLHRVSQAMGYREQLTFFAEPIRGISIPEGGAKDHVIISQDRGGSEFYQLYLLNLSDGSSDLLSDGKSRYSGVVWAPDGKRFGYSTTERNGRNWDIRVQDLTREIVTVLETTEGSWSIEDWSSDGEHMLVSKYVSINESYLYELDLESGRLKNLFKEDQRASIGYAEYGLNGDVYYSSDAHSEFMQLYRLDSRTSRSQMISSDVPWNVEGFSLSPDKKMILYSFNEGGISRIKLVKAEDLSEIPLPQMPRGILSSSRFSPGNDSIALSLNTPVSPTDVYRLNITDASLVRWTQSEIAGLDRSKFVEPELISYDTFDGRSIPAFVYAAEGSGPHPVLISIHGGPEGQYRPFFSTTIQSLVKELGVTYIAPNVRGSAGYGKSYLRLDNGKLREDSVKDIGALLDWIDIQPDLDRDRVVVMGGSYGGYMVLASMVHYGDRLKAAVERVGISNFVTFLENTQPYRQDLRRAEYGDERIPEMREFLTQISPLTHVDKMVTPVLISQGANDPRVPLSESEQIVDALKSSGVPVWYVLAANEGHGFRRKANRDYNSAVTYEFLHQFLNK